MKKAILLLSFIFCILYSAFSQSGEWVWLKGDSIHNQIGNHGVPGIPSPLNNPQSLYEPCEWTDLNGNFWLFGGVGYYPSTEYNTLWKFDTSSDEWVWMKGTYIANDTGNYGTQGLASPLNNPPARGWGMATWVDTIGNLWMFGGYGAGGEHSDLWKYNISTNEWTWMKGPATTGQAAVFGIQGIPNTNNTPGASEESACTWVDKEGDFWYFGGGTLTNGYRNDLWKYEVDLNQWVWMKGSQLANQNGIYGIQGTESVLNNPGSRVAYSHWMDKKDNFWIFGGASSLLIFNDLWRYNPTTNNWTWMGGDSISGAFGNYGTKCLLSAQNVPGARMENRASWTDQNGNFWMFGGGSLNNFSDIWNDLWMYCVATNQWTRVTNDTISNPSGEWGIKGVSSPANKPNGRAGAVSWKSQNGQLYFFGGSTSPVWHLYNDLWKYTIDTACAGCNINIGIETTNEETSDMEILPNPANSSLIISFQSFTNQFIEIRLYNTLGKQIYFSKEEITKEKFEKEINVEKWSNGIYFLQVKMKGGGVSKKIVVSHP